MGTAQHITAGKRNPAIITKGGKGMTRTECENQVLGKLLEIREILAKYSHNNDSVCIGVGQDSVWAFRIVGELNNRHVKDIDIFKFCEEV